MKKEETDELQLEPVQQWDLPTDPDEFRSWLRQADVTFEEFRTYPAWENAPPGLREAMES